MRRGPKPLMPVYRVRTLLASRPAADGTVGHTVQAIALVVAGERSRIPAILFRAQPEIKEANIEVVGEYNGSDPLWPVRIGTGTPKRFVAVPAANRDSVALALLEMVPPGDPWRGDVESGWYEIDAAVNRTKEGAY